MQNIKQKRHEDKSWLLAQRELPCIFTGSDQVEACHVRKGTNTGKSQKPHDYFTLSLDYRLHREQHSIGEISFWQKYLNEYPLVMMEMVLAFAKLRYLVWLTNNNREKEAIDMLSLTKL